MVLLLIFVLSFPHQFIDDPCLFNFYLYVVLGLCRSVCLSPSPSVTLCLPSSLCHSSFVLYFGYFPSQFSLLTLPPVLFVIMTSRSCMCNTNHAFGGRVGKRLGGRLFPRRSSEKGVISSVTWTPFKTLWTIPYKATQDGIEKKRPSFFES